MTRSALLDRVVEESGLMSLIAPFTIRRLLIKADVRPDEITPDDLLRALPQLEQGLGVYLDGDQLREALSRLRNLASG
jgi:hypothetical protein